VTSLYHRFDNPLFRALGLSDFVERQGILFSEKAIYIGVVYNYLPLMIFPLFVALDEITDPQNLGAVARSARGRRSSPTSSRSWRATTRRAIASSTAVRASGSRAPPTGPSGPGPLHAAVSPCGNVVDRR
jgi:hypothetical protein